MREDVPPPGTSSNQLKLICKYSKSCIIWGRVKNLSKIVVNHEQMRKQDNNTQIHTLHKVETY